LKHIAVIMKKWLVGATKAYSARIHAVNLVKLIDSYAHEEAVRKISLLDPVYRAAALHGYKVHDNELYVKLNSKAIMRELNSTIMTIARRLRIKYDD